MRPTGKTFEVLLMDDPSGDDIHKVVQELNRSWLHLVTRDPPRGLGYAVLEGMRRAKGDVLVVMDADLSHPPEKLPEMVAAALQPGTQLVIGSRYVPGATIDGRWSMLRHLNSRGATMLARLFTWTSDPMSGFLAMRKELLTQAKAPLDPIGYKIGLELIVKCAVRRVGEIPIHFSDRHLGKSKMGLREQIQYVVHVRRLARWKYGELARMGEFGIVGASGLLVNLVTLTFANSMLLRIGITDQSARLNTAVAIAVLVAMTTNFFLNRMLTFGDKARKSLGREYIKFVSVCLIGAVVNWGVTTRLAAQWTDVLLGLQGAAVFGVLAGMIFNYIGSRVFVFSHHPR